MTVVGTVVARMTIFSSHTRLALDAQALYVAGRGLPMACPENADEIWLWGLHMHVDFVLTNCSSSGFTVAGYHHRLYMSQSQSLTSPSAVISLLLLFEFCDCCSPSWAPIRNN